MDRVGTIGRFRAALEPDLPISQLDALRSISLRHNGRVPLPMDIWTNAPGLASLLDQLSGYFMSRSKQACLTLRETEIVILVVARFWRCSYIWDGHARILLDMGFSEKDLACLESGSFPVGLDTREKSIYSASMEIQYQRALSDETYQSIVDSIGHRGISELTALLGFYSSCAFVLISYDIPGRK